MPSWSSRLIPPYSSHSHSQSAGAGGPSTSPGVNTSPSPTNDAGNSTRLPFGHLRSQSYQVTSPERNGLGVRGRASDGALRSEVANVDLTTGKCICCNSTVRWPANLLVFRCMICLTINDLKPVQVPQGKKTPPITIDGARAVVECCLQEFLLYRRWMKNMPSYPPPPPPGHSPLDPVHTEPENTPSQGHSKPHSLTETSQQGTVFASSPPSHHSSSSGGTCTGRLPVPSLIDDEKHTTPMSHLLGEDNDFPIVQKPAPVFVVGDSSLKRNGAHPPKEHAPVEGSDYLDTRKRQQESIAKIFKPLEDYIVTCFDSWDCINGSFMTKEAQEKQAQAQASEEAEAPQPEVKKEKTVLAEGEYEEMLLRRKIFRKEQERQKQRTKGIVDVRSAAIDWESVKEFYDLIIYSHKKFIELTNKDAENIADNWDEKAEKFEMDDSSEGEVLSEKMKDKQRLPSADELEREIEETLDLVEDFEEARFHITRVLLKTTENLLKRPGRPLREPDDIRFLLIMLFNPLLYSSYPQPKPRSQPASKRLEKANPALPPSKKGSNASTAVPPLNRSTSSSTGSGPGQHSGIIKRILGLMSNLPNMCHHYLVSWFSRLPEEQFRKIVELGGSFVTYRLTRQHSRKKTTAGAPLSRAKKGKGVVYNDDWQIQAAAKFMALLFSANNNGRARSNSTRSTGLSAEREVSNVSAGVQARLQAQARGHIIPTSDFYNMLLDYSDLIADFDAWENKSSKFCFCQYPFLFSMGAKIHILEYDARRQMELKAREAFFSSLTNMRAVNQYLVLKVRRDCLVEDSLRGISEGVGGMDEIKKGLKIEFVGEDGVDAGGLRKEWFLLLVRDVFDPNYGMFIYDEDSRYCYFNPNSFESSEEFYLVGVVFGLAIYNSTILDVALPPCVFKKLLQTTVSPLTTSTQRPPLKHTVDDLAVFRPALANGLRQLLEFEGDVEEVYCRTFAIEYERFGQRFTHTLIPGGENVPVSNTNRKDFVDKYLAYLLDSSVAKQFEPFKRGFYTVCGGNALSLFRPEELELLVRGSDEPLDISALRAVAIYENWGTKVSPEQDPAVKWFWNFFERITPKEQRLLLSFITGSDRIPAMGATNLVIKLVCLGADCERFPVARTCFNALCLYRYKRREKLERMLWRAVEESEGFGLK